MILSNFLFYGRNYGQRRLSAHVGRAETIAISFEPWIVLKSRIQDATSSSFQQIFTEYLRRAQSDEIRPRWFCGQCPFSLQNPPLCPVRHFQRLISFLSPHQSQQHHSPSLKSSTVSGCLLKKSKLCQKLSTIHDIIVLVFTEHEVPLGQDFSHLDTQLRVHKKQRCFQVNCINM